MLFFRGVPQRLTRRVPPGSGRDPGPSARSTRPDAVLKQIEVTESDLVDCFHPILQILDDGRLFKMSAF